MKHIFITIAFIAGILLALQVRSFKKIESLVRRNEPKAILAELRTLQIANAELRSHLSEVERALGDTRSRLSGETTEEEINKLELLAGETSVRGEGIELTFNAAVEEFWISDLIATLVSAGAEAISINDIRLTAKTAGFRLVSGGLLMGQSFFKPPFKMAVIGPAKPLKDAVTMRGGLLDRMEKSQNGLKVSAVENKSVIIPALAD